MVFLRTTLAVVAGAAVLGALTPGSVVAAAPQGTSPAAVNWYHAVVVDLRPLQSTLVSGLQAAASWQQGSVSAADAAHLISKGLPRLTQVEGRLARLDPLPGQRRARDDYVAAIALYVAAFRLELAATELHAPTLVSQLQRSFQRIRGLGDVTFDQGTARLAHLLGDVIAGADVQAAGHVPDWTAQGLAPGAPLVATWPGVVPRSAGPPSPSDWAVVAAHDGAPSQSSVHRALTTSASNAKLTRLTVRLGAAAARLTTATVPARDRRVSAVARLGLLVDAEATLAATAACLSGGSAGRQLERVAIELSSIGATLREQSGTTG